MAIVTIRIEESLLDALVMALEALQLQKHSGYKKRAKLNDDEARRLFLTEYSAREIGDMYGRNHKYVTRWWENLGLDPSERPNRRSKHTIDVTEQPIAKTPKPTDVELQAIIDKYGPPSGWQHSREAQDALSALKRKRAQQK